MCIITDKNDVVLGIFVIPGLYNLGDVNIYFPYNDELPIIGSKFKAIKNNLGIWIKSNLCN